VPFVAQHKSQTNAPKIRQLLVTLQWRRHIVVPFGTQLHGSRSCAMSLGCLLSDFLHAWSVLMCGAFTHGSAFVVLFVLPSCELWVYLWYDFLCFCSPAVLIAIPPLFPPHPCISQCILHHTRKYISGTTICV